MAENLDLQEIHDFLIDLASKAGDMITAAHPTTGASGSKKNCKQPNQSADLVTETDKAVEDFVSHALRQKYPHIAFMGEETHKPGTPLTPAPTFIVDPIDGTTNFVHAYPYACISLGLAVALVPVVGVIYNPFTHTLYSAVRGRGAFKNRTTPLPLKQGAALEPLTRLDAALVALEWGSDRSGANYACKTATFAKLCAAKSEGGTMVHSVRSLGSAALNYCAVAEGTLDLYWEGGCWAWDVCAGWCILVEAGGFVVDGNPGGWEPRVDGRKYLALRKGVSKEVVEEFWSCVVGRMEYSEND